MFGSLRSAVAVVVTVLSVAVVAMGFLLPQPSAGPDLGACGPASTPRAHANWFTNWGAYQPRTHCVTTAENQADWPWIIFLLVLNIAVITGYLKIFWFWRRAYMSEPVEYRNRKLMQLAWIFAWCAVCGYLSSVVMFVWPGYRLLALALVVLNWWTWMFAANLGDLKVSLSAHRLKAELEHSLRTRAEELERQVEQRTAELGEAVRRADEASAAKSRFVAHMSHEIRTPMNAVLGYADLLGEEHMAEDERLEAAHTIQRAGRHLMGIIDDILDISRIESGRLKIEDGVIRPAELLAEIEALLSHRAAEKGIALHIGAGGTLPEAVGGDPTRLRQVLLNLLGNAIKFTTEGSVTLRAWHEEGEVVGRLVFEVRDTGLGMTPEECDRVFEAFEQAEGSTARRFGGTGLGLTIAQSLARLMGGEIVVHSEPGVGSVFTATVTARPIHSAVGTPSTLPCPAGTGRVAQGPIAGRVLVVDDGADNRRLLRHFLTRGGVQVAEARDGQEAIDLLRKDPAFDLVLMDLHMPVLDGHDAMRQIRAMGMTMPIVALTADAMAETRVRCQGEGFSDCLTKPIRREVLLSACAGWISQGRAA